MRTVKNIADCQQAFNDLFAWKDKLSTNDWDFKGLRITNASPGVNPTDYAILSQIPAPSTPTKTGKVRYTIVFESPSSVVVGANISPAYVVGTGRTGKPIQVWLNSQIPPPTGPLSVNVNINGNPLLVDNLVIQQNDTAPVISSTFNTPLKHLGLLDVVAPLVALAGGAGLVSIGVVVEVD